MEYGLCLGRSYPHAGVGYSAVHPHIVGVAHAQKKKLQWDVFLGHIWSSFDKVFRGSSLSPIRMRRMRSISTYISTFIQLPADSKSRSYLQR